MSDNSFINKYKVKNLVGHTPYNFTLKVCTSLEKCSGHSKSALVTTQVGVPGKMMKPQVSLVNPTMADVSWTLPDPPAGSLDLYEISVEPDDDSSDAEIFNVTGGMRARLEFQSCREKYKSDFKIRAINIDQNNFYVGPWSDSTEVICGSSGKNNNNNNN